METAGQVPSPSIPFPAVLSSFDMAFADPFLLLLLLFFSLCLVLSLLFFFFFLVLPIHLARFLFPLSPSLFLRQILPMAEGNKKEREREGNVGDSFINPHTHIHTRSHTPPSFYFLLSFFLSFPFFFFGAPVLLLFSRKRVIGSITACLASV